MSWKKVGNIRGGDGPPGSNGADGIGLSGALIDRDGGLVITMTDGATRSLGKVVGSDGGPGRDGKDGADGLGFDDLDVSYDGARGITLRFARGEQVKEFAFSLPVVLDAGVYKSGQEYQAGDGVTWGGQYWIATEPTSAKPDTSKDGKPWRLAVRRGRDGKDAERVAK